MVKKIFVRLLQNILQMKNHHFHLQNLKKKKVVDNFRKLQSADFTDYITLDQKDKVLEKYDDYKYPYSKYGLGVISAPPKFNYCSDSFMNDLRLECGSYGYKSPVKRWNDGDNLWGAFRASYLSWC